MQRLVIAFTALALTACATPPVVDERQLGDNQLSCVELSVEMEKAKDAEYAARKERGVTGTNVAAAVLFWPGLAGTYVNTEEAIDAAQARYTHLQTLADKRRCP